MHLLLSILSGVAIACAVVAVGIALFPLVSRRPEGQHASRVPASRQWQTVRVSCVVLLLCCRNWVGGVGGWLLLAGVGLLVVWSLVFWLQTRYRLTRAG